MKRMFSLMVSFVMILTLFVAIGTPVSAKTSGVWSYRIYDGNAIITACDRNSAVGETEVPTKLGGYPVTRIDDYAFENCKEITRIVIPKGVTEIGLYAFHDCVKLQGVVIPEGVISMNGCAFENCSSLTAVTIPDSVQIIWQPFSGCQNLTSIEVDPENPYYYSKGNCLIKTDGKTLVGGCKGSVIPEDDGILAIDDQAFYGQTGLTGIAIPDSVKTIGYSAFCECSSLKKITIGKNVKTIDPYAFYHCTSLAEITLPNSVKTIGEEAFSGCKNLKSATIGSGLGTIAEKLFQNCRNLTKLILCKNLKSIGSQAFSGCKKLASITIPAGVENIDWHAFYGTAYYNDSSHWKNGVLYIGKYLIEAKNSKIPSKVTVKSGTCLIADVAFADCTALTEIVIPDSVTVIGEQAFRDCKKLGKITLPGGLTYLEAETFTGTAFYQNGANWKNGVLYIGKYLVKNKEQERKTCIIKPGTRLIASGAFTEPYRLTELAVPVSLKIICYRAFYSPCPIAHVYYSGTEKQWKAINIHYDVYVPANDEEGDNFSDYGFGNDCLKNAKLHVGTPIYTVSYKLNGGTNSQSNPHNYLKTGATVTLKTPTKKGYTFKGWYLDSKFKKKVTKIIKGSTGDKTLYAKWSKNTYRITYTLNGGKNSRKNPKSYTVTTSTVALKNPTRRGYTFKGWYTDAKFKTKISKISKGSTGNKRLYAKWKRK